MFNIRSGLSVRLSARTRRPDRLDLPTPEGLQLEIPPADGRRIGVEYSPDLGPGSWIPLGDFIFAPDDDVGIFIDEDFLIRGSDKGLYRGFPR